MTVRSRGDGWLNFMIRTSLVYNYSFCTFCLASSSAWIAATAPDSSIFFFCIDLFDDFPDLVDVGVVTYANIEFGNDVKGNFL